MLGKVCKNFILYIIYIGECNYICCTNFYTYILARGFKVQIDNRVASLLVP